MAEQNKGLAGIFNDPNFITGVSILAANSDPRRHWSEGYKDASERLSAMERSALNRAEMELRKQKFEQEQQAMEAERRRAAEYQKAVQSFGPETSMSEQINALLPYTTPGQGANLLQSLAGMQEGPNKTSLIQNYEYFAEQEKAAGRTPPSLMEFAQKQADIQRSSKAPNLSQVYNADTGQIEIRDYEGNLVGISSKTPEAVGRTEESETLGGGRGEIALAKYNNFDNIRALSEEATATYQNMQSIISTATNLAPENQAQAFGYVVGQYIPFADDRQLANLTMTLKSNQFLGQLQRLKDRAPTGASGLGQVTKPEIERLESRIAALDPAAKDFKQNLQAVLNDSRDLMLKAQRQFNEIYPDGKRPQMPGYTPSESSPEAAPSYEGFSIRGRK